MHNEEATPYATPDRNLWTAVMQQIFLDAKSASGYSNSLFRQDALNFVYRNHLSFRILCEYLCMDSRVIKKNFNKWLITENKPLSKYYVCRTKPKG